MKYKEFKKWCNERAADSMWDILTAMKCIEVMRVVDKFGFGSEIKSGENIMKLSCWQHLLNRQTN